MLGPASEDAHLKIQPFSQGNAALFENAGSPRPCQKGWNLIRECSPAEKPFHPAGHVRPQFPSRLDNAHRQEQPERETAARGWPGRDRQTRPVLAAEAGAHSLDQPPPILLELYPTRPAQPKGRLVGGLERDDQVGEAGRLETPSPAGVSMLAFVVTHASRLWRLAI